jgi:phosphatidate phosphatase APP1
VEAHLEHVAPASAQVEIVDPKAPFFVVSDFDDTLAVTQVVHKAKLLESALLKDESSQPAVPGMAELFGCIRRVSPRPPGFALVSGSPVQYGPRIGAFLAKNGFPFLGLYLRELSPGTLQNYKQPVIRELMKQLPNDVVFFGDSGEHDPEVYAQMRQELGARVRRTYIRDAGHSENKARFEGDFFFTRAADAARDAAAHGLADKACVEKAFGDK